MIRQRDLPDIEILQGFAEENATEQVALRQGENEIVISAWLLREVAEKLRSQANFMEPVVVRDPGGAGPPHAFGRSRVPNY